MNPDGRFLAPVRQAKEIAAAATLFREYADWLGIDLTFQGFEAELVVSGINHGSNLGDDITYSGTVAAALEAIVLGLPGIAVSQQSNALELDFRIGKGFEFRAAATFTSRLVAELGSLPLPEGTLLNQNFISSATWMDGYVIVSLAQNSFDPARRHWGGQARGEAIA